jgi:hypothetical protein
VTRLQRLFRLASVALLAAALFHAASVAFPAVARLEYGPDYPAWRHLLFIGIDVTCAWLFRARPEWFVWAYGLLAAQQIYSHGAGAARLWALERRVDWMSAIVVLGAPLLLAALVIDRRRK